MHHGAPVGQSWHGRGCACGCVCTQRPETALAYALLVWSAMADTVRSGGEQGETGKGLTDEHRHAEPPFVVARDLGSFGRHFDPTVAVAMAWGSFSPP